MQSQFVRESVNDICLPYNNNVIIIRKSRRAKKSFDIFVKHISLLFFVVFLIKVILFSNRKKNYLCVSFQHCLFLIYRRYRGYINELYLTSFYSPRFDLESYNSFYNNQLYHNYNT